MHANYKNLKNLFTNKHVQTIFVPINYTETRSTLVVVHRIRALDNFSSLLQQNLSKSYLLYILLFVHIKKNPNRPNANMM